MRRAMLVLSMVTCVLLSGCWMAPGFDGARRFFNPDETTLTPSSIGSLHQLWTAHQPLVAKPITDDQRVYLVDQSSQGAQNDIIAFDANTGTKLWVQPALGGVAGGGLQLNGGTLTSAAANGDGMSVFYLNPGDGSITDSEVVTKRGGIAPEVAIGRSLSAYLGQDANGPMQVVATIPPFDHPPTQDNQVFRVTLPGSPTGSPSLPATILSAMSVSGSTFYAAGGNRVYAVDMPPTSCSMCVTWTSPALNGTVTAPPVIVNDQELAVIDSAAEIVFLDRTDGHVLWRDLTGDSSLRNLAADDGQVYVMGSSGVVDAFSTSSCGQTLCRVTTIYGATGTPAPGLTGQVVLAGGLLYIANGVTVDIVPTNCGAIICFPSQTLSFDSGVTGLIVSNGKLYVTTQQGLTAFGT
jgi:outer membrane protein assembly factor BamB